MVKRIRNQRGRQQLESLCASLNKTEQEVKEVVLERFFSSLGILLDQDLCLDVDRQELARKVKYRFERAYYEYLRRLREEANDF